MSKAEEKPRRDLFEDDDDEKDATLKVNSSWAKEYTSRKQREELRKFQHEPDADSDSSSESESEDENGELLTPSMDVTILKTINALRNKDDRIYDPSNQFFPDIQDDDEEEARTKQKSHKPKRIKDVMREQILEKMSDDEEDGTSERIAAKITGKEDSVNRLVYNEEQQSLRSAFLDSTKEDGNDEDDWMVVKKKGKQVDEEDEEENELIEKEFEVLKKSKRDGDLKDPRGEIQDGDGFLLDFIKNKKWIDKNKEEESSDDDGNKNSRIANDSDDDSLDQLEKTDDFESKYNFRFEEAQASIGTSGADLSVMAYARGGTMNTLRRQDDTRKQKRMERKERKAAERKAKEEQLRRLKNAKREEMESRLKQIKAVLGEYEDGGSRMDEATIMKLMEGDFDPEKFEEVMKETYSDDFYREQDAEWKTDTDVRGSLLKDDDGDLLVGQDGEDGGLYDNQEEDVGDADADLGDENVEWAQDDPDGHEEPFAHSDDKEESEVEKKLREKMKDELYKLDYEDIVAGMPTRFKYRKVEPNSYGLTTEEILFAKDTTLKQFVSLKKMAPYREEGEHYVGGKKRRRFREMLKHDMEKITRAQEEDEQQEQTTAEQPKKKKRRQKKGKKKIAGEEAGAATESKPVQAEEETTSDGKDNHEEELTPGKQKRKKKGKKKTTTIDGGVETQFDGYEKIDGASETILTEKIEKKRAKKEKKKSSDGKKRKKHKKVKIDGISSSRLASYGF